jgi:hypothetical protein
MVLDVVLPSDVIASRFGVDTEVRYVLESTEPSALRNCDEVPPAVEYPTAFLIVVPPTSRLSPDCNSCNWFALGL